jgi:hypothetical protein
MAQGTPSDNTHEILLVLPRLKDAGVPEPVHARHPRMEPAGRVPSNPSKRLVLLPRLETIRLATVSVRPLNPSNFNSNVYSGLSNASRRMVGMMGSMVTP